MDEKDAKMVGQTLENYPLTTLVKNLGLGVAEAQAALNEASITAAIKMMEAELKIGDNDPISLLELGFTPAFYHFQSATLKVSVSISMKIEEQSSTGVEASLSGGMDSSSEGAANGASKKGQEKTKVSLKATATAQNETEYTRDELIALDKATLDAIKGANEELSAVEYTDPTDPTDPKTVEKAKNDYAKAIFDAAPPPSTPETQQDTVNQPDGSRSGTTTPNKKSSRSVAMSATLNHTESRKHNLDVSGAASLEATLVSIPPPEEFKDYVRESLAKLAAKA